MRELTFKGFLAQYVRKLSVGDTNSLYKLAAEAAGDNPRLREPLLLYALYSGKEQVLLQAVRKTDLFDGYKNVILQHSADEMTQLLMEDSPLLPAGYHKVWHSYQSRRNIGQADYHTKELMRQKLLRLQTRYGVTNYRIYTDLKLNPGNLNAWLKHGAATKGSLDTARQALRYVESYRA